eukprot:468442_1
MDDIQTLLTPKTSHLNAIKKWILNKIDTINENDIISVTTNNDIISINTTIYYAEKLLSCEYYNYYNLNNPSLIVSRIKISTNYNIPSSVSDYIDFITPTIRFPSQMSPIISNTPKYNTVNPIMLQYMYNSYGIHAKSTTNKMAVSGFQNEGIYEKQDITKFWNIYNITAGTLTNIPPTQRSQSEVEASLDIEYLSSMGQSINIEAWWTDGTFSDALLQWTVNVMKDKNAPLLFSVSYSISQKEVGQSYCDRLDTNLAAIGTSGISLLFASGDSGAGGGCNTGQAYIPQYPCASPYVCCVGGVTNSSTINLNGIVNEEVWINGGGGFSIYTPIQSWQTNAVSMYLVNNKNNLPPSKDFNASGRAYPDVSAQSEYFAIINNQMEQAVSGTSASTPTVSGIFALLNDLRVQNNMKPMGFLNPLIYQIGANYSDGFNDCIKGFNKGCQGPTQTKAFDAIKGWDPASGWGSPNYKMLAKYVLQTGYKTIKFN